MNVVNLEKALANWKRCTRCSLHKYRRRVVFGRGEVPAEVLMVGEAPGRSEDLVGEAFVGRAGRILDAAISDAAELVGRRPSIYITNIVSCIPLEDGGGVREPLRTEWLACWPRLEITHRLVDSEKVVLMGTLARVAHADRFPDAFEVRHPAYILRRGGLASMEYRTFVRELCEVFMKRPPARLGTRDVFGDIVRRKI